MRDNSFVPVSHRVFVDTQNVVGIESLRKVFNNDYGALVRFITTAMQQPSGTYGKLTWEHK